jgi:hypothetical protein
MIWSLQTSAGTTLPNRKINLAVKKNTPKSSIFVMKIVEKVIKAVNDWNNIYTTTYLLFNLVNDPVLVAEIEIFKPQL